MLDREITRWDSRTLLPAPETQSWPRGKTMKDGALKDGIRWVFRRLGYSIKPYNQYFEHDLRRAAILRRIGVDLVFDVGANIGQYGLLIRKHGFAGTLISFEPIPEVARVLRETARADPAWHVHELAITDEDGESEFHIAHMSVVSSLLVTTNVDSQWKPARTIPVPTRRLDTFVAAEGILGDFFLKLDVQGAEPRVLSGCAGVLDRLSGVELEMSGRELYEGESLIGEMSYRLESLGFRMVSIEPICPSLTPEAVWQVNAIFLRTELLP